MSELNELRDRIEYLEKELRELEHESRYLEEEAEQELIEQTALLTSKDLSVMFSSKRDDHGTPDDLFKTLHERYGFTVDLCADASNAKLPRFYSAEDDGRCADLTGEVVFMNPPYGRAIGSFMKAAMESNANFVVCLVPCRTDTEWWHDYVHNKAAEVYFIKGRLKFIGNTSGAPFPSAVVVYSRYSRGATKFGRMNKKGEVI